MRDSSVFKDLPVIVFQSGYYDFQKEISVLAQIHTQAHQVLKLLIPKNQHVILYYTPQKGLPSVDIAVDIEAAGELIWLFEDKASGTESVHVSLDVRLIGERAMLEANGIYQLTDHARGTYSLKVAHEASYTYSHVTYAGIIRGHAKAVFAAKAVISPHLQGVEAHQSNKNLLRSHTAEVITRPELEIDSEDVKCSHGATVGQLDPEALFYLTSRGLSESMAMDLLERAFLVFIQEKLDQEKLDQEKLENFLRKEN